MKMPVAAASCSGVVLIAHCGKQMFTGIIKSCPLHAKSIADTVTVFTNCLPLVPSSCFTFVLSLPEYMGIESRMLQCLFA